MKAYIVKALETSIIGVFGLGMALEFQKMQNATEMNTALVGSAIIVAMSLLFGFLAKKT